MRKAKDKLRRGYRFSSFAGAPLPTCSRYTPKGPLSITLQSTVDPNTRAEPVVKSGDAVAPGQPVADFGALHGAPVHAPVGGTVTAISKTSITITPSRTGGSAEVHKITGASAEWENLAAEKLRKLIYLAGIPNIEKRGMPTEGVSAKVSPGDVETIIVDLVPDEILNPDPAVILEDMRLDSFVTGIRILTSAYPSAGVSVAVSSAFKDLAGTIDGMLSGAGARAEVVLVGNRYPQSHPAVLMRTVTGRNAPVGIDPIHAGILIIGYQTPIHVTDAVVRGIPVISRRIAIAGPEISAPGHIDVPVGTSISELADTYAGNREDVRIVLDGLMSGPAADETGAIGMGTTGVYFIKEARQIEYLSFAVPGFRKDSITNTFAAKFLPVKKEINTNIHGERRACLNCSYCSDVCPAGIMPNILHRYVEKDMISESLPRFGMLKCIDCNLCTYVCPSKIPLARLMKEGKERLLAEGFVTLETLNPHISLKGLDQ